ncbi:hypothetical protein F441_01914 [Phytophthora nicotianae CJ01A1]|uniref:Uncharacterized protein n=2 Tax=Phytophthora nicotianae TaxID=4792 RepID=W2HKS3_PHYNI|nr:hypothetical protein L915_01867 [Phytophthora nicotianae]ETL48574.1 hypothetical protein L916_01835 [Phytophthora nicotianae]ETP25184.1 hypothetical protein F441_01914 [Phytophthora nicotianae CJ01A1]
MSRALDDLFRMDPDIGEKVQYLRTASRKPEYDKLSSDDHDAINTLVHNMLYAMSEEIYDTNWASMKTQNWRARLAHLRVHTNNHLETWLGHFKDGVHPNMTMTDTVASDDRTRSEYAFDKIRIGVLVKRNYDEEISQVLRLTSHFVAEHVEKEYVNGVSKADLFKIDTESKSGLWRPWETQGTLRGTGHVEMHLFLPMRHDITMPARKFVAKAR